MKVFLDTNVLLSAWFGSGLCAQLFDGLVVEGVDVLLDERVLAEFERIARDKLKVEATDLARPSAFLRRNAVVLPAAASPSPGIPDPDDAWIIAAALAGRADWFVTGDKALLGLGDVEGMPILDPRTAYTRLHGLG